MNMAVINNETPFYNNTPNPIQTRPSTPLIGDELGFDAVEAFNLLRTNLFFSFPDEKSCHIVGITSSVPASGKSLISSNLAFAIAKTNKKVLLIDGDMRLPTIAQKLGMRPKPGLSNILVSACEIDDAIQNFYGSMDVIPAGDIPPKPSELLGSDRMKEVLEILSERYEYIIFDTTPITVVPDALALVKMLHGVIIVSRKDHDEKPALRETLRQLELSKAKILGCVFNSGEGKSTGYGKGSKYGYKKYGYGGRSYGTNGRYGSSPTLKETKK